MRVSLAKKIFFYFLVLSTVPIIIIDTYFYYKSKTALINRTFDQLTTIRIEKTIRIKNFFNTGFNHLSSISNYIENKGKTFLNYSGPIDSVDIKKLKSGIKLNLNNSNIYNKVFFVSNNMRYMFFNVRHSYKFVDLKDKKTNYNFLLNFVQNNKNKKDIYFYDVKNDYTTKNHSIFLIKNINENNIYKGSVILEISLNPINKIMYENNPHNGLGKTGETYLVGSDYYMRSSSRFQDNSIFKTKVETIGVKEALKNKSGNKEIKDYRNIPVLSSYGKINIKGLNWVVLAEIDTKEAMVPIYLIRNDILFMSLLLSILMLGLVEMLSSKITSPVVKLKEAADEISKGEFGKQIYNVKSNDEIGDLVSAFNQMNLRLKIQSKSLERERLLRTKSFFDGQEIEKQRLSKELHDSLGQAILALKMKFERIKYAGDEKRNEIISEAEELFLNIMNEIRNTSNNLMPAVLTEFGLVFAIQKIVREYSENIDINIDFEHNISDIKLNKKTEIHIYRIVQEALNNIIKHAEASFVKISIIKKETYLKINIKDNGKGFIINKETLMKGNGLSNIKERVNFLGGKYKIHSEPQEGTDIDCLIPIT